MSADTSILPSELLVSPLPFVGFAGMDVQKNPVHKMIWDSFSTNKKPDRLQVQYKLLPASYEFPVSKPKRTSYEWYHPKGILKKNWLLKHQHVLPAVVALFQEMDWNDMQWSEHQLRCAAAVQALKGSLQGQATKVVVVLLQRATQPMPGEEQLAGERTAALASACDLNPKLIFVFPYNEHLQGYTYRLEASFLELASSYYMQMAKQIRAHRDQLTDAAHLTLRIRHQFKLGVIAEIRGDHSAALKCYTMCYDMLSEIRVTDANCHEIKTVAGFLNYKLCRLMFRSMPRDAVQQFKQHVERFRERTGFRELRFEHYAWLSLQYSAFAELFCDAIKQGLPALQTEHPGIYYHKAADHMSRRKRLFAECSSVALAVSLGGDSATYANQFYSEFFGVRTTKLGDASAEQQLFALAVANERQFNHSVAIIQLLGQAMAQYKIYRCLRFRKKLAVDMAEEYLQAGDHSKALTLYSLMLSDYRSDKWHGIFTHVLLRTLQAARLSGAIVDFLTCSLETMSPRISIGRDRRLAIMDNFWRVLQHSPPVPEPGDPPVPAHVWRGALEKIRQQQTPAGGAQPLVTVDLDHLTELFECTLTFRADHLLPGQPLHVDLYIRTRSELSFKLTQIEAVLFDSKMQFTLQARKGLAIPDRRRLDTISDDDELWTDVGDSILLQPNVCHKFSFVEPDFRFAENEELHLRCVQLTISMGTHRVLLTQSTTLNRVPIFRPLDPAGQCMHSVRVHRVCYVQPQFHLQATVQHAIAEPMLSNEFFRTEQQLINSSEALRLHSVSVTVTVPASLKSSVFLCTELGKSTQRLQSVLQFDVGDLAAGGHSAISYYIVSLVEASVELQQRLSYELEAGPANAASSRMVSTGLLTVVESPVHRPTAAAVALAVPSKQRNHTMHIEPLAGGRVRKHRDDTLTVRCEPELTLSARFFTLSKQPMRRAFCDEDVLLRVDVEVRSPSPIDILEMFLVSDHNVTEDTQHQRNNQRQRFASACTTGHKMRDVRMLRARSTSAQWKRSADASNPAQPSAIDWLQQRGSSARLTLAPVETPLAVPPPPPPSAVDKYKSNLLAKLPANSTIVGSTTPMAMSSNLMSRSSDGPTLMSPVVDRMAASPAPGAGETAPVAQAADATRSSLVRHVYNRAIDAFALTDHLRGFVRDKALSSDVCAWPVWGVYCVRWRRSQAPPNSPDNESKFVIQGIEVVDPLLNIYCSLDERMYVKRPMTLTVTIRNPTRYAVHLLTSLKSSDNFIFSGNTQLNVSIFAQSSFELSFNLYPMRAGWHALPEFEVKYNTQYDDPVRPETDPSVAAVNQQLLQLVQRWMPKRVFVLPMQRQCPA